MARDIDDIIAFIRAMPGPSPTEKQVLIMRIEPRPTREELEAAHRALLLQEQYKERSSG